MAEEKGIPLTMKKLYILAVAAFAAFAFAAVAASSAFALVSQVLCDGASVTAATEAACLGTATGNILLEENLVKPDISCEVTSNLEGMPPGATNQDILIISVTFSNCLALNLFNIACTVVANNLPWLGLLTLSGANYISTIQSSGAGTPSYSATCAGTRVTCSAELTGRGGEDYTVGLVEKAANDLGIQFSASEQGECPGNSVGTLEGELLVEGLLALTLSEA